MSRQANEIAPFVTVRAPPAPDRHTGPVTRPPSEPRITLIGRAGCHLCDDARAVIEAVAAEAGVGWQERSIDDDEQLRAQYWEQIPVTLVDGKPHDFWRVSADRLRAALARD